MDPISDQSIFNKVSFPGVSLKRQVLTRVDIEKKYQFSECNPKGISHFLKRPKSKCVTRERLKGYLHARLPILTWLRHYDVKKYLIGDFLAGFTTAIMQISQGMGYALLADLDPIIGLYMAFFPPLVYAVFGTSRHTNIGLHGLTSAMLLKPINELSTTPEINWTMAGESLVNFNNSNHLEYTPTQVTAIVSFSVGLWMLFFAVIGFGILSSLLSDTLVSGFTTGAAVHIFVMQFRFVLGINVPSHSGSFKLFKACRDIIFQLPNTNLVSFGISCTCLVILMLHSEIIKPSLKKVTSVPFPMEMFIMIVATLASRYGHLNNTYDLQIIGKIPSGLPQLEAPPFELFWSVVLDGLSIAIVSYVLSMSIAKILAMRGQYSIDANQELYAQGLSNLVASMFYGTPVGAGLARSTVQAETGGQTQMGTLFCCFFIFLVLYFIGPFFEFLPKCILGCIVMVALKGLLLQCMDLPRLLKISRSDAALWILTCLSVIVFDINSGLFIGFAASLLMMLLRSQIPKIEPLVCIPGTDVYLSKNRFKKGTTYSQISLIKISGNISSANYEYVQSKIMKIFREECGTIQKDFGSDKTTSNELLDSLETNHDHQVKYLILDLSGVPNLDANVTKNLIQFHNECQDDGIKLVLTSLPDSVVDVMKSCGVFDEIELVFYSIHDAVSAVLCFISSATNV